MFRAYAALITLGLIWGTNFIYMKWATALSVGLRADAASLYGRLQDCGRVIDLHHPQAGGVCDAGLL